MPLVISVSSSASWFSRNLSIVCGSRLFLFSGLELLKPLHMPVVHVVALENSRVSCIGLWRLPHERHRPLQRFLDSDPRVHHTCLR